MPIWRNFWLLTLSGILSLMIVFLPLWAPIMIFGPLFIVLAWSFPNIRQPPLSELNVMFFIFMVVFAAWPEYGSFKVGGLPALNPQRLVYGLLLVMWIFTILASRSVANSLLHRMRDNRLPVNLIIALLLWRFCSIFMSDSLGLSLAHFVRELLTYFPVFFIAMTMLRSQRDVTRILIGFAIGGFIVCSFGMVESFIKHNLFANWLTVSDEFIEFALASKIRDATYRIQVTFDNPLLLVDFLVFLIPILVFHLLCEKKLIVRVISLLTLLMMPWVLYRTGSRSALVAVVVQGVLLFSFLLLRYVKSKKSNLIGYLMTSVMLVSMIGITILANYIADVAKGKTAMEISSLLMRQHMLTRGIPLALQQPILGYGVDQGAAKLGINVVISGHYINLLDNYFLTILLDSGLPALIIFIWLLIYFIKLGLGIGIRRPGNEGILAGMLALSLVGFSVIKLINSQEQIFTLMFMAFAMLLILREEENAGVPKTINDQVKATVVFT